jgi:hypothetical protein
VVFNSARAAKSSVANTTPALKRTSFPKSFGEKL